MATGIPEGKPGRIALLLLAAALAIALAVMEALATHTDAPHTVAAPWTLPLQRMETALQRRDIDGATRAWHDAYLAALGSGRWQGMLAVGDAALRLGQVSQTRRAATARAHHAYLSALFRAREDQSVDGVLHAGEAFAALGDTGLAIYCLRIAEPLVAMPPGARR